MALEQDPLRALAPSGGRGSAADPSSAAQAATPALMDGRGPHLPLSSTPDSPSTLEALHRALSSFVRSAPARGAVRRRVGSDSARASAGIGPWSRFASTLGLAALVTASSSVASAAQSPRPDQVFRVDARTGKVVSLYGVIEQHGLERVTVLRPDGQQARLDSGEVVEVVFGDVPPSFSDARRYAERGDFENAVARYRVAAGDASARPVVQGAARLAAARSLMKWGETDPTRFREAAEEAQTFLSSFAEDRNVPTARELLGRAQVLAGDAAAGAATLEGLFAAGQAGTLGYPRLMTLQAGHDAAHAFLLAGQASDATRMFDALGSAVTATPREGLDAATTARLDALSELALLGPGFVNLAEGKSDRAESFFRGQVGSVKTGAGRSAARLGLGEALLKLGRLRPAQLELASASALSYADADVEARALVGLAEVYLGLGDASEGKKSLERVLRDHGATPSAARASELLKTF